MAMLNNQRVNGSQGATIASLHHVMMISSQLWIIMVTMTFLGAQEWFYANAKLQFWMDRYGRSIFKAQTTTTMATIF